MRMVDFTGDDALKPFPIAMMAVLAASMSFSPAASAQPKAEITGTYCLVGVREVGSCIRLLPDGRFQYFLAYGAYDEKSEGRWRAESGKVIVDSPAYGRKPEFVFKGFRAGGADAHRILVHDKSGQGIAGVDILAKCGARTSEGYTQYDGFTTTCTKPLQELSLGVLMVGLDHQAVKLETPDGPGKTYVFEFDPGDLGRKPFNGVALTQDGPDTITMTYGESPLKGLVGKRLNYKRQ